MSAHRWHKLGRLFSPEDRAWWMVSHAASPVPLSLEGANVRVLVSGRDARSRARIGAVDFALTDPANVTISAEPLCDLGEPGTFDENGMVSACAVDAGSSLYIYYSGWQLGKTVPFWFFGGLLVSTDGALTARRFSRAPVLDRSDVDPIIAGAPWIVRDGDLWRMWYTAGVRWAPDGSELKHYYHIRYAESDDGIAWRREGKVAIDFQGDEYAIGRPCVVRDADRWRMWFSRRGRAYRIGYAESMNGIDWTRRDELAGIDVSPGEWDGEMIEYAAVFDQAGSRWMLYNGNGFGRSGLGLAVLE